jgi:acetolactate synthase I/II/III large subunit
MKNTLDGGEAVLEACRKIGVDYIVSSPGTEWAPVWEAMANQMQADLAGPKFMDVWHETLAVNIATGYTMVTGKPQCVLLHAGSGLLQGTMGIHGALLSSVPMVVISGETMTYGEDKEFDPGSQWVNNLSVVGGTTRMIEPMVKFSVQAGSTHTVYESIIRAAEMSQRAPIGPTYLSVSTETLMEEWNPPENPREVPPAPKLHSAPEDVQKLAGMIAKAKNPVVLTEAGGRDPAGFDAMVRLSELAALPVVENPGALFANFPKDHPMHQGSNFAPFWDTSDLVIVVSARAPWYPPSDCPPNADIVVIDETPHRPFMVYQSLQANMYLEGDIARTLSDVANAVEAAGMDSAVVDARRARLIESHDAIQEENSAIQAEARKSSPIDQVWLTACLNEVMPDNTIYVDEVTTHTGMLRKHLTWNKPQTLFSRQGGLGQGLGLSLGIKLASPDSPVVTLIGDGAFLYNPVLQALGAARDYNLPTMTVLFNNTKYLAMQGMHLKMYPDGTAVETDNFHGTHINAPDLVKIAEAFGAYGEKVTDPEQIQDALRRGLEATQSGKSAIINVLIA